MQLGRNCTQLTPDYHTHHHTRAGGAFKFLPSNCNSRTSNRDIQRRQQCIFTSIITHPWRSIGSLCSRFTITPSILIKLSNVGKTPGEIRVYDFMWRGFHLAHRINCVNRTVKDCSKCARKNQPVAKEPPTIDFTE